MEYLASSAADWVATSAPAGASDEARLAADASKQKLVHILTDLLLADNLIVLAGLGTSLCVKNSGGVSVAPTMKSLWDAVQESDPKQFAEIITLVKYVKPSTGDDIELLLSRSHLLQSISPNTTLEQFITRAEQTIAKLCRFVQSDSDLSVHEALLRKAARRSTRKPRLKLFTTNYDLCFELAATRSRFVVVDGFSHLSPQEFDGTYFGYDLVRREPGREVPDYIQNVFHLYKLHGSVDWAFSGADNRITRQNDPARPHLIYPRHTKFEASYDQPFIEVFSRFQIALRQPNTALLVIGVGFNDHHIAQPILSAVRSNIGLRVLVASPNVRDSDKPAIRQMADLIRGGDGRLVQLASTFEDMVATLPNLVSETEEEQHRRRLGTSATH
jgi:hypothetical protein